MIGVFLAKHTSHTDQRHEIKSIRTRGATEQQYGIAVPVEAHWH
jgi:hypothetical protein